MNPNTADLALPLLNVVGYCAALLFLGCGILFALGRWSPVMLDKAVGQATPGNLGAIRALTAGILLASTVWEDLPSSAAIPTGFIRPMGVMQWFNALPGFGAFSRSETALAVFQWSLAGVLALAAAGLFTRVTVPLGACGYLVLGGLLRQYCWFYHTGLIPLYLLAILSFTPCGDAWSVDRWLRVRRGEDVPPLDRSAPDYSWGRYLCWVALAVPYTAAALSKLRRGGLDWWDATNFRSFLYGDSLAPMEFQFSLGLRLADAPDWLVEVLALAGLGAEILYFLVLIVPRARLVLPVVMFGMHVGILFLQNILFFDLLLLQVIFFDGFGRSRRMTVVAADPSSLQSPRVQQWYAAATCGLLVVFLLCWVGRVEDYPLTAMPMYASNRGEPVVRYVRVLARYGDGRQGRAPLEECLPAMRDGRYRAAAIASRYEDRQPTVFRLFRSCARRYNRGRPAREKIVAFTVEHRIWNFAEAPHDPQHGELSLSVDFDVTKQSQRVHVTRGPRAEALDLGDTDAP